MLVYTEQNKICVDDNEGHLKTMEESQYVFFNICKNVKDILESGKILTTSHICNNCEENCRLNFLIKCSGKK